MQRMRVTPPVLIEFSWLASADLIDVEGNEFIPPATLESTENTEEKNESYSALWLCVLGAL
jgi:hypothetical protein